MTPSRCWVRSGPGDITPQVLVPAHSRSRRHPTKIASGAHAHGTYMVFIAPGGTLLALLAPGTQNTAGRGPCPERPQPLPGPHHPESRTRSPAHPGVLQALPCLLSLPLDPAILWGAESPAQLPRPSQNGGYSSLPQGPPRQLPTSWTGSGPGQGPLRPCTNPCQLKGTF